MKSLMRLIKSALEYRPITDLDESKTSMQPVPKGLRGIYALYRKQGKHYNVVYVGMSSEGKLRKRLFSHKRNRDGEWTHFSYFEVWDNISDQEIKELEGLFRQIYRFDERANRLNVQQTFKPLNRILRSTENVFGLTRIKKS
ncbi:GIY-YIG nuclease family protein [Endozoicomonas acroporae]|uniref:GIY-YIG nuclease family protein n=1 Tax=Endozoicomonas acroporae TaxID=1701104 RepID=UPI0013D4E8EA|nr:GIY-YIG nuclease family protein [Endozoicomonas acroporae]